MYARERERNARWDWMGRLQPQPRTAWTTSGAILGHANSAQLVEVEARAWTR